MHIQLRHITGQFKLIKGMRTALKCSEEKQGLGVKVGWYRAGLVCRRPWAQSQHCMDQVWLWAAIIPALRRRRQESQKCKAKLSYIKCSLGGMSSCLNNNQKCGGNGASKTSQWLQIPIYKSVDRNLIQSHTW